MQDPNKSVETISTPVKEGINMHHLGDKSSLPKKRSGKIMKIDIHKCVKIRVMLRRYEGIPRAGQNKFKKVQGNKRS